MFDKSVIQDVEEQIWKKDQDLGAEQDRNTDLLAITFATFWNYIQIFIKTSIYWTPAMCL